jgi:RNA polymerase sigma factor (sigma-70 family)
MTNEALAIKYKSGDAAAINLLWEQNKGLMFRYSYSFYTLNKLPCARYGITQDDIEQEAFFALRNAATAFKEDGRYKFTTYLRYHAKNAFNGLVGRRTKQSHNEPLNNCASLNTLVGENEDTELGDLVKDETASEQFNEIEDAQHRSEMKKAVAFCLSRINEKQADTLRKRFYDGLTLEEISERLGVSQSLIRQRESAGLRALRQPKYADKLSPFIFADCYKGTGLTSFRENMCSSQERFVEMIEQERQRLKVSRQMRNAGVRKAKQG